jgi:hypothetical protein
MASGINNLFILVHKKTEGALTVIVFLASITMFLIGVNLFAEDTYTSYMGLQAYQATFNLTMNAWPITFWSESLLPQVGQIVFFYIFFSDMKRNWWAALIALGLLCVDFYADIYYRTNGVLSLDEGQMRRTIAGGVITFFYFTVGAELFISIGWGLAMTTMAPAIKTFRRMLTDQKFALGSQQPRRGPSHPSQPSQPSRQPRSAQRDMEAIINQRNQ